MLIKYKINILIWKLYNKLNKFFILFVSKITLRILKYLLIQGLYLLGVNIIVYFDIIEFNEPLEKFLKFSLFIGLSVASVYHYYKFFDLSWLKLKKKFKKNETVENENLNNIEIELNRNNDITINFSSELKPSSSGYVDVWNLNDPNNLERVYLVKAIWLNIFVWWMELDEMEGNDNDNDNNNNNNNNDDI